MGVMLANGGAQATTGSLMCEHGVNLRFIRQDDVGKMQEDARRLRHRAEERRDAPDEGRALRGHHGRRRGDVPEGRERHAGEAGPGVHGQGRRLRRLLARRGQVHGPAGVEGEPGGVEGRPGGRRAARRRLEHRAEVAGRQRALQQPGREDLRPDCLNWVAASDYIDAAEKYVAGYCEKRPVVNEGRRPARRRRSA